MSLSFLGSLASLLPGYVQGQRTANQDNWQDLMNYNQVQSGQLSNAFTEATWQPRLDMFQNEWMNSSLNTYGNLADARIKEIMRPYQEMQAAAYTYHAPQLAPIGALSLLKQWQMVNQTPSLLQVVQGGGTPSSVR